MAREIVVRRVDLPWDKAHKGFVEEERQLNLATVLRVSLFALPGAMAFPTAINVFQQFLTAMRGTWHGPLRVAEHVVTAPDFVRKPVAEVLGLGVAIELARDYGWNGHGPQSIDALRQYWGEDGNRPDLLFTCHGSPLQFVGEAKGRIVIESAVPQSAPNASERKWLRKLKRWYADKGLQFFLSVAIGTPAGVTAHIFDPGEPQEVYPGEVLEAAIRSREGRLWATAPDSRVELDDGRQIRGQWFVVTPDGNGEDLEGTAAFLGIADDDGVGRSFEAATATEQVSGDGRTFVILRRVRTGERPELTVLSAARSIPRFLASFEITRGGSPIAWGEPTDRGGFVVSAGSRSRTPQGSFSRRDHDLRRRLLDEQILTPLPFTGSTVVGREELVFAADHTFDSPSAAARVVLGTAAGGPSEWKMPDGTRLRHIGSP